MAESRSGRRLRRAALWAITAALAGYALLGDERERQTPTRQADNAALDGKLRVTEVDPIEAHPGDALSIVVSGLRDDRPIRVMLSSASVSKIEGEILHQKGARLVVQLPADFALGVAKLRIAQGDMQSKPFEFRVERLQRRKQARNVIGGLALFIFGLRTLSNGLRSWSGDKVRDRLGRLTRGRALGLGTAIGAVMQLTTTASGFVVGLLQPRMLALTSAISLLIGAQMGAAATVAILPLASAREGLLVLAIGVAWISFSTDRRSEAFGNMILGGGLLFYGLHLLRVGFEPMVADPQVLPYIGALRAAGPAGYVACGVAGVLLAALLQGPAPAFVVVLGLAQSTGALDLPHALAVLSGTSLGAAIDTTAVAWSFGNEARRLALAHLCFGVLATVAVLSTVSTWSWLADVVVSGDPAKVAYGKKVLLPNVDEHLAVGFVAAQLFVGVLGAISVPWLALLARRMIPQRDERTPRLLLHPVGAEGEEASIVGQRVLARVVREQRVALEASLQLCSIGDRTHQTAAEHALADSRVEVEEMVHGLVGAVGNGVDRLRHSAIATLQLQRSAEDLLRLMERCVEENFTLDADDYALVRTMHDLLLVGMADLMDTIERGDAPDLEQARSREITLNAREAAGRQVLLGGGDLGGRSTRGRRRVIEVLDAYENVGNHLYRLFESFSSDVDDAVA